MPDEDWTDAQRDAIYEYLSRSRRTKGDKFEDVVYHAIQVEINEGNLGLRPEACKVFRQKGYYSRDRERDIVVDVSIEVTLPDADHWSLLWVWECKDYKSRVPVDDLEEFWAKLQQIGGVNIKGGFATTAALQSGALKFARSKGISVVRFLPRIEWVLHKDRLSLALLKDAWLQSRGEDAVIKDGLTRKHLRHRLGGHFYAITGNATSASWRELLKNGLENASHPTNHSTRSRGPR